jgi:hypothetical protein
MLDLVGVVPGMPDCSPNGDAEAVTQEVLRRYVLKGEWRETHSLELVAMLREAVHSSPVDRWWIGLNLEKMGYSVEGLPL